MSPTNDPATASWHLDKRVPVFIIFTLILQFVGLIVAGSIAAAKYDSRLTYVEQFMTDNKETKERLAVIEFQLRGISSAIDRVESKLTKEGE